LLDYRVSTAAYFISFHFISLPFQTVGLDLSPFFNLTSDTTVSYRPVGEDGSLSPSWEILEGGPVGAGRRGAPGGVFEACAVNLPSSASFQVITLALY
jgi:hypothetical protein